MTAAGGSWPTTLWYSDCKDCRAEREASLRLKRSGRRADQERFEYSARWADRKLDRGESRSDRCERHRRAHAEAIQALAVPYVDLRVIGEVPDPLHPTGPFGGLGPLPVVHKQTTSDVSRDGFEFGMGDAEIVQLLEGLKTKRVAVVVAGTGTGKSTFMPFRLMTPPAGAALRLTDHGPIIVTEPRRAAAIGVARYVGEELCLRHDSRTCNRHVGPGYPVGYQVSGDKCWDGACDLIYATDGSVINWIRDGHLARFSTVIVDEAHERNENIDIILTQLREQIRQHEHLRVIITSATLDEAFFVSFFGKDNVFQLSVPAKKSFGYGVPLFVGLKVDDATIRKGTTLAAAPQPIVFEGWSATGPVQPDGGHEDLQAETRNLDKLRINREIPVTKWTEQMPQAVVEQVVAIAKGTRQGDILAFLPTNTVIAWTVEQIAQRLASMPFDTFPLLSTTDKKVADKALAARGPGERRKIVVSSNLAETSLTVKGVRYVVDSGLICEEEWDPKIASGSFPTKPHSQSGLRQRWGRVGRDAPGWVFPLYTAAQFLMLPRNTPPESTRTNLEQFYMKLVAAGADLAEAVVPGSFIAPDASLDQDARDHLEVFASESRRVRRVLELTGAIDTDGDLTSFGRELERYPGEGAEALALMLADQLACVHEVALAQAVLGSGHLVGWRGDCILKWSKDWPTAWRVRAAQCHRGLAVGCTDDLDVLLRITSMWQSTTPTERPAWCKRWWINEPALVSAWDEVMSTVDMLSAATKSDADRHIEPRLALRARAVLSHCMVSARYRRGEGNTYFAEGGDGSEGAILGRGRLVEPMERLLAFHRFRRDSSGDEVREPIISHTVAMLDGAELSDSHPEGLAFELIRRVAAEAERHPVSSEATLDIASLLAAFPIGLVVERSSEGTGAARVGVIGAPFELPDPPGKAGNADRLERPGFDREWNPYGRAGYLPEEEAGALIGKSVEDERNDAPNPQQPAGDEPSKFDPSLYDRVVLAEHLAAASSRKRTTADQPRRGVIVGYERLPGGRWALLVDALAEHQSASDPLHGVAGEPGDSVECIVAGLVPNHDSGAVQLTRKDGKGRLYADLWQNPGLDAFDRDFLARLAPGSTVRGILVPDGESGLTVTVQPGVYEHLSSANRLTRADGYQTMQFYPARIVEGPDKRGNMLAELEHIDAKTGMSHRFQVRRKQLEKASLAEAAIGTKVLLSLEPDRSDRRRRLNLPSARARELAEKKAQYLSVDKDVATPKSAAIPASLILDLVGAGVPSLDAWAFYKESFHQKVDTVLPFRPSDSILIPERLLALFFQRRSELGSRWGVEIAIRGGQSCLDVVGDTIEQVAAAVAAIEAIARTPRVSVQTDGSVTRAPRDATEARSDVHFVCLDSRTQILTIVARSKAAAEDAMRDLLRPAVGILTLSIGRSGFPVGNGEEIRALCEAAGCRGQRAKDEPYWTIRAASEANLRTFFALASDRIRGSSGTIVSRGSLKFLDEEMHKELKATQTRAHDAKVGDGEGKPQRALPETAPSPLPTRSPQGSEQKPSTQRRVEIARSEQHRSTSEPPAAPESKGLLKSLFSIFRKRE